MVSEIIGSAEIEFGGLDKLFLQEFILLLGFREEHLQVVNVYLISFLHFVSVGGGVRLSVCPRFYVVQDGVLKLCDPELLFAYHLLVPLYLYH